MAYTVNGVPFPQGMDLKSFFSKLNQGKLDRGLGMLASPMYNLPENEDARLMIFENMLAPDNIDANTSSGEVMSLLNTAMYGDKMGNEASYMDPSSQIYDFPYLNASYQAEAGYGLPLHSIIDPSDGARSYQMRLDDLNRLRKMLGLPESNYNPLESNPIY